MRGRQRGAEVTSNTHSLITTCSPGPDTVPGSGDTERKKVPCPPAGQPLTSSEPLEVRALLQPPGVRRVKCSCLHCCIWKSVLFFLIILFLSLPEDIFSLLLERGREREREREKHPREKETWIGCHLGTCPDWELNLQPFSLQSVGQLSHTSQGQHQCERETYTSFLPYTPGPGIKPSTWACALTKEWNPQPSGVRDDVPTSPATGQGSSLLNRA